MLLTLRAWQDWRTFRAPEPSRALMEWLWRLIPPGALVVPLLARIPEGSKDYPLDRYSARGVPCLPDAATPPLPSRDRNAQHAALLELLPAAHQRELERQAPRKGIPRWRIEAAFYRDLVDLSTLEIADALDLRDDASRNGENGSRSARRYATHGRIHLRTLGAWPWALSTDKRALLPRGWHRDQRYAAALADWHHAAVTATLRDSLRTIEAATGSTNRGLSASVYDAAETAYRTVYEHHTAATAAGD